MKYRRLDENGDYVLGRRDGFLTGRDAVGQAIATRLRLLLGEWWENKEEGLPLFEKILGVFRGEGDIRDVDLILSQRIQGTKGVTGMVSYDSAFDPNHRIYSASCRVNTLYGEVGVAVGLGANNVSVKVV